MPSAKIKRIVLSEALNTVSKIISPSPVIPLLGTILLESNNGNSRVTGTNLELGVSYTFRAEGEKFKTCAPAKTITSLIGVLGSEEVELKMDIGNQSIIISSDTSNSNVKCVSSEEFPDIPKVTDPSISLDVAHFKEMVERASFATGNDEASVLSGILLKTEMNGAKEKLILFATNGQHLSYEECNNLTLQGIPFEAIAKGHTLEMISRILPDEGELEIQVEENKAMFHCNHIDIVCQLITGKFPDYKLIEASMGKPKTRVIAPTIELLQACRQLKVFAAEVGTSKMEINGILMNYSASRNERGDSDITIFVKKEGDDIVLGISVFYLNEFLEICKTGNTIMEMKDNHSMIVLRMENFPDYYHVIMPITL